MKIKVWDKIEKKLCAVNSIEFIDSEDRPGVNCFIGDSFTWIKWIESKDAELFLFTGLYDANYNELYDGDCIKFRYVDRQEPTGYGECGGVISFEQGCFVVREIGFDYEAKGETPDILKNWLKDNSCLKTGHNNRRVVMTIQEGELIECRKCGNDFQWVPRNSTIKPKICPRCQKLKDFEKKREYNKKMLSRSNLMDYKRKSDPNPGKYTPKNKSGLKRTKKRNKSEKAKARDNADLWFSRYIRCKYHYQILVDGTILCKCFITGKLKEAKNIDNGHCFSRVFLLTRYEEDNCRPQGRSSNRFSGEADHYKFRDNLLEEISEERFNRLDELRKKEGEDSVEFYREQADKFRKLTNEILKEYKIKKWW